MALLVADSGPLIALARLELLWLPARLAHEMQVPEAVWHEVDRAPRLQEQPRLREACDAGWLTVHADPGVADARLVGVALDEGELAAIGLALQVGATVLIDELRGRAAAARLGLEVVGTLGLLLLARETGDIGTLRPLIDTLQHSGYYLSPRLVHQVLARAGE